jgi:hypothetical protein
VAMRKRRCLFFSVVPLAAVCLPYYGAESGGQTIAFVRSPIIGPTSFIRGGSNDDSDNATPRTVNTTTKASPNVWSSHSLHRFNEDMLVASSTKVMEEDSPKAKKTTNKERRRIERIMDKDDSTLVREAPPVAIAVDESQSRSNRNRTGLFRWFGSPQNPSDKDVVKLNPLQDATTTNTSASDTLSEESNIGPDLATRLWWVNVWTQQLPDPPEDQLRQIDSANVENRTTETSITIPESIRKLPSVAELNLMMNTTDSTSDTVDEEEPPPSFVSTGAVSTAQAS